jgi:hypothetical protein
MQYLLHYKSWTDILILIFYSNWAHTPLIIVFMSLMLSWDINARDFRRPSEKGHFFRDHYKDRNCYYFSEFVKLLDVVLTDWVTDWLTKWIALWATVILEQLIVPRLLSKFSSMYGTRMFIILFAGAGHLYLRWTKSIHFMPSRLFSLNFILIPSLYIVMVFIK